MRCTIYSVIANTKWLNLASRGDLPLEDRIDAWIRDHTETFRIFFIDFTQACTFGSYVVKAMAMLVCCPFVLEIDSHCRWQKKKYIPVVVVAGVFLVVIAVVQVIVEMVVKVVVGDDCVGGGC